MKFKVGISRQQRAQPIFKLLFPLLQGLKVIFGSNNIMGSIIYTP